MRATRTDIANCDSASNADDPVSDHLAKVACESDPISMMNKRQKLGSGKGGLNVLTRVRTPKNLSLRLRPIWDAQVAGPQLLRELPQSMAAYKLQPILFGQP